MKKLLLIAIFAFYGIISFSLTTHALSWFGGQKQILTQKKEDVVGKKIIDAKDPLRDGTQLVAEGIGDADGNDKIYYEKLDSTKSSRQKTADFVKALVNYALAVIGLIALIYLLYHGFLTATAGNDEKKAGKWREGIKYGAIALIGIGLARFIASIIFWLIQKTSV